MDAADTALTELQRQRRTIVVVDVVESVRAMERDEAGFIHRWRQFVAEVRERIVPQHAGVLVKSLGDGLMLQFRDPVNAVAAARHIQEISAATDTAVHQAPLPLRVGVHVADVIIDDLDIYGTGVNLAARLAALAGPGQTIVSASVREAVADGVHCHVIDLGECYLKHVSQPVRAYRLETLEPVPRLAPPDDGDMFVTVAVLPFTPVAGDPAALALGEALVDALNQRLALVPGLRVISRLSTRALGTIEAPVAACRDHLDVAYVVTGSFGGDLRHLRPLCQLVDARDRKVVFGGSAAIEVGAMFAGDDPGLNQLVAGLSAALVRSEVYRVRRLPVPTLASYTLLVGGSVLLHRLGRRDFLRAREVLEALRDRHPRAAAPAAMLAKWYLLNTLQGWTADAAAERRMALTFARQALDHEPDHSAALAMDGLLCVHFGDDLRRARASAEQAVVSDPQEPQAWLTLAGVASYEGRGEEAVAHAQRAISLSPVDPCRYLFDLLNGAGELAAGRPEAAALSARTSVRLNAQHAPSLRLLTIAEMLSGRGNEARAAASALLRLDPAFRVSSFAERYPGRQHAHTASYVSALLEAGLPP